MSREEERNIIAHKIAWEYTKHYDPLLSKESWCEMAARDAFDWADPNPSVDTVKKIICYALKHTNIMLAEDLENGVEWELLIKKAMED